MKVSAFLIGQSLAFNHNFTNIYHTDPKAEISGYFSSEAEIIQKNADWISKLNKNAKQALFVAEMINIPDTIPLSPHAAFNILNDSPYPWAVLVYNSDHEHLYEG